MACSNVMRCNDAAHVFRVRGAVERQLAQRPSHSRPTGIAGYLICAALTSLITGRPSLLAANDGTEFFEKRIRFRRVLFWSFRRPWKAIVPSCLYFEDTL